MDLCPDLTSLVPLRNVFTWLMVHRIGMTR
jgi:hypothetical protein